MFNWIWCYHGAKWPAKFEDSATGQTGIIAVVGVETFVTIILYDYFYSAATLCNVDTNLVDHITVIKLCSDLLYHALFWRVKTSGIYTACFLQGLYLERLQAHLYHCCLMTPKISNDWA